MLLTCFNRPLSDWLQETTYPELRREEGAAPVVARLVVMNYHQLCDVLGQRYGVPVPGGTTGPRDPAWAEALDRVAAITGPQFDAIVVDEAQDFAAEWWLPLLELRERGGYLYLFLDDNQRIYSLRREDLPVHEPPFWLPRNVRFTRRIHEMVMRFYRGDPRPEPPPLEGEPPVVRPGRGVRQDGGLLRRVLHQVLVQGQVPPRDVVVLTPVGQSRSVLQEGAQVGNWVLTWDPGLARRGVPYVQVSTIHRFKGLERPVVILAEMEELEHYQNQLRQMLLYVGLSRASARLYVLGGRAEWFQAVGHEPGEGPGGTVATFAEQVRLEEELERVAEGVATGDRGEAGQRGRPAEAAAAVSVGQRRGSGMSEVAVAEEAGVGMPTPHPSSGAAGPAGVTEAEAVFIECDPSAFEGNAWVAEFLGSGRAYVVDDPPGLVVQAWDGRLPAGRLRIVQRLHPLPFTRSAWLVRVEGLVRGS